MHCVLLEGVGEPTAIVIEKQVSSDKIFVENKTVDTKSATISVTMVRPNSAFPRIKFTVDHAGSNIKNLTKWEIVNGNDVDIEIHKIGRVSQSVTNLTHHIGVYSFALKPEEHQPSGTCNFSRIDSAILTGNYCPYTANTTDTLYVYAVNYNVLRIMSGMGGLSYSN